MSQEKLEGACLCGAFRFVLRGPIDTFNFCHCSRCRRRTGSAFAAVLHARSSDFTVLTDHTLRKFEPSGWNARHFCGDCGSPLPMWDNEEDHVGIPAGLITDLERKPDLEIMTGSKAAWGEPSGHCPLYEAFPEDW